MSGADRDVVVTGMGLGVALAVRWVAALAEGLLFAFRLKGRGLLDRKSGQRGDQYVKLKVVLPEAPDEKLKEFLEGWETGRAHDPRKGMEPFV